MRLSSNPSTTKKKGRKENKERKVKERKLPSGKKLEKILFLTASKKLGIYLAKEVKDFYNETYRPLKKEIEENT
jgi:hypothetical protein